MANVLDAIKEFKIKVEKFWKKLKRTKSKKKKDFDIYNESRPPKEIHDRLYSHLLYVYTEDVERNLKNKSLLKNIFFYTVMGVFLVTSLGGGFLFLKFFSWVQNADHLDTMKSIVSVVGVAIPTLSTMIVSLVKIPEIITKYLFNVQEEKYMKQIIKNLQDYDKEVFGKECDINSQIAVSRSSSQNVDNTLSNFGGNLPPESDNLQEQSSLN